MCVFHVFSVDHVWISGSRRLWRSAARSCESWSSHKDPHWLGAGPAPQAIHKTGRRRHSSLSSLIHWCLEEMLFSSVWVVLDDIVRRDWLLSLHFTSASRSRSPSSNSTASVIKQLMLVDRCWSIDVDMCQHAEEIVATCGPLWAKNLSCCCFSCGDQMTTRAMLRDRVCLVVFFFVFCFYKIILHNWGTSIMPSWKTWRSSMSLLVWRIRSWLSCSQKLGRVTGYEQNIQFQWDLSHQFMRASLECSPKRMGDSFTLSRLCPFEPQS